jgi:hypothetical protein
MSELRKKSRGKDIGSDEEIHAVGEPMARAAVGVKVGTGSGQVGEAITVLGQS